MSGIYCECHNCGRNFDYLISDTLCNRCEDPSKCDGCQKDTYFTAYCGGCCSSICVLCLLKSIEATPFGFKCKDCQSFYSYGDIIQIMFQCSFFKGGELADPTAESRKERFAHFLRKMEETFLDCEKMRKVLSKYGLNDAFHIYGGTELRFRFPKRESLCDNRCDWCETESGSIGACHCGARYCSPCLLEGIDIYQWGFSCRRCRKSTDSFEPLSVLLLNDYMSRTGSLEGFASEARRRFKNDHQWSFLDYLEKKLGSTP